MGGGGGDGGYSAKQEQIERDKQAARQQLNALFGIAPTSSSSTATPQRGRSLADLLSGAGQTSSTTGLAETAATNKAARDKLYDDIRTNAFTAGKRTFDERKTDAARNNKFALFAQGLAGGSEDVDQNALLQRTYDQGLLDLGAKADAAKADFKTNDEQTRLGLLQSIDAGMDQGSAVSSALAQLKNNSDSAAAAAQGTSVGDLFDTAGLLYTKSAAARGKQAAALADPFSIYSRRSSTGTPSGSSGIISTAGV